MNRIVIRRNCILIGGIKIYKTHKRCVFNIKNILKFTTHSFQITIPICWKGNLSDFPTLLGQQVGIAN